MAKETGLEKTKRYGKNIAYGAGGSMGISLLDNLARAFGVYKNGGRVKGVGKATHGYGKAMKNQSRKK